MKVREFIEFLSKCNPDFDVYINGDEVNPTIEEIRDITDESSNRVSIWF